MQKVDAIRYNRRVFDSKAECDQLNLAHVTTKNIYKKKKVRQTSVPTQFGTGLKICEGSPDEIRKKDYGGTVTVV